RECRDPWAAKLAPEIESSRAKASVKMWNLVSTRLPPALIRSDPNPSIADSGMEYLTHQARKRVGPWSNKRRLKDILACVGHVRFTQQPTLRTSCRVHCTSADWLVAKPQPNPHPGRGIAQQGLGTMAHGSAPGSRVLKQTAAAAVGVAFDHG